LPHIQNFVSVDTVGVISSGAFYFVNPWIVLLVLGLVKTVCDRRIRAGLRKGLLMLFLLDFHAIILYTSYDRKSIGKKEVS